MPRRPASVFIGIAGLLPAWAAALGLGEVIPRSALNQPFAAEIPLTASAEELTGLTVALATAETFERYGLARPAFLGDLRFTVTRGAQGPLVRVSSSQPVVEPFVTLLLDVQWPTGRLLREYTVLLDPPAFAGGRADKAAPAEAAAPAPRAAEPTAAAPEGAAPRSNASRSAMPAGTAAPGTYGPVARNDTLWGIANRNREGGADLNQMMLAIFRANPEAFAGNINRLRAGSVLRIPAAAEVGTLARGDALTEVRRQNADWQRQVPEAGRLQLVPPRETPAPGTGRRATEAPGAATGAGEGRAKDLQAALEESKRQLEVRDAELAALRSQLAAAGRRQGAPLEAPVTPPPGQIAAPAPAQLPGAGPALTTAPAVAAPQPTQATAPALRKPRPAARPAAEEAAEPGFFSSLFGNPVLWIAAALVLAAAAFVARRRSAQATEDRPLPRMPVAAGGAGAGQRGDMIVVEERRPQATGAFERSTPSLKPLAPVSDSETALERTISTDGPVNLDQADPIAEADFHMAYGLYDQAADLLNAALAREPGRRDLTLKLLEVYFVWENRDGFLKEAAALRDRIQPETDADWTRIVLMGKQLAPNDPMFAGTVVPTSQDLDLTFSPPGGGDAATVDLDLGTPAGGGLDFDLGDATGITPIGADAPTVETYAADLDLSPTTETPTVETRYGATSTIETPTVEAPMGENTLESPTIESWSPVAKGDESGEQTEEIDLDDLAFDLTGLDQAARDVSTGLQETLIATPDQSSGVDFDLSGAAAGGTARPGSDTESTQESVTLRQLTAAMEKKAAPAVPSEDTVEQPRAADADASQITRSLDITGQDHELDIDLNLGEPDLTSTGLRTLRGRGPDDATMTEVGTKLDLARAYLDMGDPDGARSILQEVMEEGDATQRVEAQQLLDGIAG